MTGSRSGFTLVEVLVALLIFALIAAAARNNTGILGMAFDATIQVLRADDPGTCATENPNNPAGGCKFTDDSIAAGVNRAVDAGARVINLSIGGSDINANLRAAVARAATAGVVVVVAAGAVVIAPPAGAVGEAPDVSAVGGAAVCADTAPAAARPIAAARKAVFMGKLLGHKRLAKEHPPRPEVS